MDPREERRRQEVRRRTLAMVYADYTAARKALSSRTVHEYRRLITTYSADWMDRPISKITPEMALERHRTIHDGIAAEPRTRRLANGRASSNAWARVLRALWNFERSRTELPDNPVTCLSAQRAWYRERARTGRLTGETLPSWFREVMALLNTTQRDYLIAVLLTGMRSSEAATLRWEDIGAGAIGRPIKRNWVAYATRLLREYRSAHHVRPRAISTANLCWLKFREKFSRGIEARDDHGVQTAR